MKYSFGFGSKKNAEAKSSKMRSGFMTADTVFAIAVGAILIGGVMYFGRSIISKVDIDANVKDPMQQMLISLPSYKQGNTTETGSYNGLTAKTLAPFVSVLKHDNTTPPGFLTSNRGSGDIRFTALPHDAASAGTNNRVMLFLDCSYAPLSSEEKLAAEQQFASIVMSQSPGAFVLGTATAMPSAATAKATVASVGVDSDCKAAAVNIR